jgi:thiamine kinase-like enzyme
MESGDIALSVVIDNKYLVKIFIPKWGYIQKCEYADKIKSNYESLFKSEFDIRSFGLLKYIKNDEIFSCPVLISNYIKNSQTLGKVFYKLSPTEQIEYTKKLVTQIKQFHKPIDFQYSTKRLLDEFDFQFAKHDVPKKYSKPFLKLRNSLLPKTINKDIYLTHVDIHYENILVDSSQNLHLIDFDFAHYGPRFLELEVLFLNYFMGFVGVPENMEKYYQTLRPDLWKLILKNYPQLWNDDYIDEIKLLIATQIVPKSQTKEFKFTNQVSLAFEYFFC